MTAPIIPEGWHAAAEAIAPYAAQPKAGWILIPLAIGGIFRLLMEWQLWSTPGLVETRFSPDALVWVAVVFHGTAAWRNHGLIIFSFCFIEHLSSCAVQLPRLLAGSARQAAPQGAWASPRRAPVLRRGFPGLGKGDAQRHRLRRRRRP